jgi:hypothetical protein
MVSFSVLSGIFATLLLVGQIQAQGTQGGHTGGVQGKQPIHIEVCKTNNNKCNWSLKVENSDSFSKKKTSCDRWTTPKGTNGVYKITNFNKEDPLSEIVLDVKKCDYYKMVTAEENATEGCHIYNAHVC